MPAFQAPNAILCKRKNDEDDNIARKRAHTTTTTTDEQHWMVQWRKPQTKKHKTWDGDAILVIRGTQGTLFDVDEKLMGSGKVAIPVCAGQECRFSDKEIQFDRIITKSDYLSGACFGSYAATAATSTISSHQSALNKPFLPLRVKGSASTSSTPQVAVKSFVTAESYESNTGQTIPTEKEKEISTTDESYWTANWRKRQTRKNKTWDGDAFISQKGTKLTMYSETGEIMGTTTYRGASLCGGFQVVIGGKEIELDRKILASEMPESNAAFAVENSNPTVLPVELPRPEASSFVQPTSFYGNRAVVSKGRGPLHDPQAEGAVVMMPPNKEHMKRHNRDNLPIVPVVVDPVLARHLRPHQKEGVKFLYECAMGLRKHEGQGCILADEMGLGKTLQTITLVWTLLKQSTYEGMKPPLSKALIVCPVSLVKNWKMEFQKWLGKDRVGVVVWGDSNAISTFQNNKHYHVLVIGYERLMTVIEDLKACIPPIGLIICDEGHRLKSSNNKINSMLKVLKTPRRIILSGTPIQNDLSEFHAMSDFCNPGLLDDYNTFKRVYETPILKGRSPGATAKETELGEGRLTQLLSISNSFVLRRDASILKKYLPPKTEYVVFVKPTELQLSMSLRILSNDIEDIVHAPSAESLALINMLIKISNSPILLKAAVEKAKSEENAIIRSRAEEATALMDNQYLDDFSPSGKLTALAKLVECIHQNTEEKIVLVSHYVSTLNILETYCQRRKYPYFRLDGQTPANKRQEYVNQFNKNSRRNSFIFLLSSKAGGVGINLIGASRLCLVDQDWNPSHDLQSMARIHRDGQKHPVFIYRFLTTGTIDEKIFQRQITKLGLSASLIESGKSGSKTDSFSRKDLRDIFRIYPDTACHTHDLLECACQEEQNLVFPRSEDALSDSDDDDIANGFIVASQAKEPRVTKMDVEYVRKKKVDLAALTEWKHIDCSRSLKSPESIQDELLRGLISSTLARQCSKMSLSTADDGSEGLQSSSLPKYAGDITFLFERSDGGYCQDH